MKAIKFSLNGKIICTAGLPENGNLSAIMNLIAMPQKQRERGVLRKWVSSINVGGLEIRNEDYHFITYVRRGIRTGDVIKLQIVDAKQPSRPKRVRVETKDERLKAKKDYMRRLKRELKKS